MDDRVIPATQWSATAEHFAAAHRGWLVSIDKDGHRQIDDKPLIELGIDAAMHIVAGADVMTARCPFRVSLEPDRVSNAIAAIRIETLQGNFEIRLRVPSAPGELDGFVAL